MGGGAGSDRSAGGSDGSGVEEKGFFGGVERSRESRKKQRVTVRERGAVGVRRGVGVLRQAVLTPKVRTRVLRYNTIRCSIKYLYLSVCLSFSNSPMH